MPGLLPAYPIRSLLTTAQRYMEGLWEEWFRALLRAVNAAPYQRAHEFRAGEGAAVALTTIYQTPAGVEAMYTLPYTARIDRPATASSTVTVTLHWTAGGVAQSESLGAVTGNTTTTIQRAVFVIRADADTAIAYSTAYGSVGATTMTYTFDLALWQVPDPVQPT